MMITLDLGRPPAKPLSLNEERRLHWRAVRDRTAPWRALTLIMARQARLAQMLQAEPCTVTVHIPFPDYRRRDPANFYPVSKAVVDGLVDAGCWPDDTPAYVTVTEPVLVIGPHPALVILEPRQPTLTPARAVTDVPTGTAL